MLAVGGVLIAAVDRIHEAWAAEGQVAVCLDWHALAGCPTANDVEAAVEKIVGHRVFVGNPCDIRADAILRPIAPGGWEARLSFARSDGTALGNRELRSRDANCARLLDPASLVIALMLEDRQERAPLSTPTVAAARPAPVEPGARGGLAFADLRMGWGLTPGPTVGATLGFGATLGGLVPLRLDVTYWSPGDATQTNRGGRVWAWIAGASVCPDLLTQESVQAALCVGIQAGAMHGTGTGLDVNQTTSEPYSHGEARVVLAVPLLGPLAGTVHLGLAVPWLRPQFVYFDGLGARVGVFQPQPIVAFTGLGLELNRSRATRGGATHP